jgi:hypothetical protein
MASKVSAFLTVISISFSLFFSQMAQAEREEPRNRDTTITQYFDKSSIPAQVDIWTSESGGYDTTNPGLWGRNSLVCLSSSDPTYGQCQSVPAWGVGGILSVPIMFTEKRSHLKVKLNIQGYHMQEWPKGSTCSLKWSDRYSMTSAVSLPCSGEGDRASQALFSTYISAAEIAKLPVGGIWEANFRVKLMQWSPGIQLADWRASITFNISDNNNQAIYFPEFGSGQGKDAQPHVDLNLRTQPGSGGQALGKMKGSTSLDMCLYDGYGSNSRQFQVQFSEPPEYPANPSGRAPGQFSVYRDGSDFSAITNRLDYGVKMYFPQSNSYQDVVNGTTYTLPNINTDDIRAVRLSPNIPQAVLCVPTPLQINTPEFNISEKSSGHYTGKLRVIFTPSLW